MSDEKKHLPRLDPEYYRGQAYVHWTMSIENRKTGWLIPVFLYRFRELLTHTAFRYSVTCPIYCLMHDHFHMVWIGIDDRTDQLKASRYFRKQVNDSLSRLGFKLQHQPHDRVLRDEERKESSFIDLVNYIALNPERAKLVPTDGYRGYKYTGCLVPGYPDLTLWQDDYWPRFWRVYSFLRESGLFRPSDEDLVGH
jgi:putative transposase